ncbi:putative NACHT domain-containing protein [Seiridium unicorne]|uniref:NACHT domain-containing protein n=1 Tax=Seiridium unicorne TaxID=138068 RepID=A0ABR2VF30_9PEZI
MEGLGAAASVIAVIDLSFQVVSLCSLYFTEVGKAKADIERLQTQLNRLQATLEKTQQLLERPNSSRLQTSRRLKDGLQGSTTQLEELRNKLQEKVKPGLIGKVKKWANVRALKWPFESKDVDGIIRNLNNFRNDMSAALAIDQTTLLLDDEEIKILEWISPILYGKHHNTITDARTEGTCEWILQHEKFQEWENAESSVVLWLHGSPGAGKTYLTSSVIDHFQSLHEKPAEEEGFAFFYCNRNEEIRRKPLEILQCLVRQLSSAAGQTKQMRKTLYDLCIAEKRTGSDLSLRHCREQLLQSVNLYAKTTLVLDALDECDLDSRAELTKTFEILLSQSRRPLRIFISSRRDRDINAQFSSKPNIEIQAAHNKEDIRRFVDEEIIKYERWEDMSSPLRKEIVTTLLSRSDGMFQWVFLQIKQILKLETEAAIRDRLGRLPDTLKSAYDEIYYKIQAQHKYDQSLANRAFKWVMCARIPLSSEELLSAIRLDSEGESFDVSDEVNESQLLHLCNNLLVLDPQRKVWRFSHLSVTEYFEQNHWDLLTAHCCVAKVCLKLLIKTSIQPQDGNDYVTDEIIHQDEPHGVFRPENEIQKYSRHFWIYHVKTQEEQDVDYLLSCLLKRFLGSFQDSSAQYRHWLRLVVLDEDVPLYSTFKMYAYRSHSKSELYPGNASILAACKFSIYNLLKDWWSNAEITLSQINDNGDNLLAISAKGGCMPICMELIKRGVAVNVEGEDYGSPLATATRYGDFEMVKFLVQKGGANVNMPFQTGRFGSALAVAAIHPGNLEIVKFLVQEGGADVNMPLQTGRFGSALAVAAIRPGNLEIVKFLVQEGGADVNILLQTGRYGSALVAAALHPGNLETIKFLVQEGGADVNMPFQIGLYGSALAAAARYGNLEIVKFLVQGGADVNMPFQIGLYGSALAAAAFYGNLEIVKFLVQGGADVNMPLQIGLYGSALAIAARYGNFEIVKFLVQEGGADINMLLQTGNYGSALAAAAGHGNSLAPAARRKNFEIVKFLVQKGEADVNMPLQTGYYGSALEAAIRVKDAEIVRFLVHKGKAILPAKGAPELKALEILMGMQATETESLTEGT